MSPQIIQGRNSSFTWMTIRFWIISRCFYYRYSHFQSSMYKVRKLSTFKENLYIRSAASSDVGDHSWAWWSTSSAGHFSSSKVTREDTRAQLWRKTREHPKKNKTSTWKKYGGEDGKIMRLCFVNNRPRFGFMMLLTKAGFSGSKLTSRALAAFTASPNSPTEKHSEYLA